MIRPLLAVIFCLVLAAKAPAQPTSGSQSPPAAAGTVAEVVAAKAWASAIERLGNADFSVRQRATHELMRAEASVVPHLAIAADSEQREVRTRAWDILLHQALAPPVQRQDQARAILTELAGSSDMSSAAVAQRVLAEVRAVRASLAASQLAQLGAVVSLEHDAGTTSYSVQLRQQWRGTDKSLALLEDLGRVSWLSLENPVVGDAALEHVAKLSGVERLYLGNSGITGSGLAHLAGLSELSYLSLKQLPIDDVKLAQLPALPALASLGLDGTQVGDAGLAALNRFPQLQTLWLDQTNVTDAGLAHLVQLPRLRTLYLPGTQAAGPGMAQLAKLPDLAYLSLKGVTLKPDSLQHLRQIEQLETLGLDHTNVNDAMLADLEGHPRLKTLWLSKTEVTDAGVVHLKQMPKLQVVYLHGAQVSREKAKEFHQSVPHIQLRH